MYSTIIIIIIVPGNVGDCAEIPVYVNRGECYLFDEEPNL